MRSCREWEEPLALAAGGDLTTGERAAVDRHVAGCPACAELLAGLEQTVESLHEAHAEPIGDAHFAAVRARVLAKVDSRQRRRWLWAAAALAGIAAATVLALSWPKSGPIPPPPLVAVAPQCGGACVLGLPSISLPALPKTRSVTPKPRHRARPAAPAAEPLETASTEEPITVKLLTDDPNVVIYWLGDPK